MSGPDLHLFHVEKLQTDVQTGYLGVSQASYTVNAACAYAFQDNSGLSVGHRPVAISATYHPFVATPVPLSRHSLNRWFPSPQLIRLWAAESADLESHEDGHEYPQSCVVHQ